MVWFIVDDGFSSSPKVLGIPRSDRMAAVGLWTTAGSWCAKHLTDGRVPGFMLDEWGAEQGSAKHLLASGLWEESEGGFFFHDWEGWQRTRSEIEEKRDAERERKRLYREKLAGQKGKAPDDLSHGTEAGHDVGHQRVSAPPNQALPIPTEPTLIDKNIGTASRPEVLQLCQLLQQLIVENGSKKPNITNRWLTEARVMLDKDGRELEAAVRLIRWCQQNPFWRANIMSMPKFRAQYDQLRLAAEAERIARVKPGRQTPTERAAATLTLATEIDMKGIGS